MTFNVSEDRHTFVCQILATLRVVAENWTTPSATFLEWPGLVLQN